MNIKLKLALFSLMFFSVACNPDSPKKGIPVSKSPLELNYNKLQKNRLFKDLISTPQCDEAAESVVVQVFNAELSYTTDLSQSYISVFEANDMDKGSFCMQQTGKEKCLFSTATNIFMFIDPNTKEIKILTEKIPSTKEGIAFSGGTYSYKKIQDYELLESQLKLKNMATIERALADDFYTFQLINSEKQFVLSATEEPLIVSIEDNAKFYSQHCGQEKAKEELKNKKRPKISKASPDPTEEPLEEEKEQK